MVIGSTLKVCWDRIFEYVKQELDAADCPGGDVPFTDWVRVVARMSDCSTERWLDQPSGQIFLKAYQLVTVDASGWFWSQVLLTLVTPLFLHLHVNRAALKQWERIAITGVGLLGAICSAFSAALLLLNILHTRKTILRSRKDVEDERKGCSEVRVSPLVIASGFLSLLCVFFLPKTVNTDTTAFTFVLLLLHLSLLAPSLDATPWSPLKDSRQFSRRKLFLAVGICSAFLHLEALLSSLHKSSGPSFFSAALANPCQVPLQSSLLLFS